MHGRACQVEAAMLEEEAVAAAEAELRGLEAAAAEAGVPAATHLLEHGRHS